MPYWAMAGPMGSSLLADESANSVSSQREVDNVDKCEAVRHTLAPQLYETLLIERLERDHIPQHLPDTLMYRST